MKKFVLFLVVSCMSISVFSQAVCTQTFSRTGLDTSPTVVRVSYSDLTCFGTGTVTQIRIVNPVNNLANNNCSVSNTGWYGFNLSVDGGTPIPVCASQIDGFDITGFSTLTVTTQDNDSFSDGVTITFDIEVTFTPDVIPDCNAYLTEPSNGSTNASYGGNLQWTSANYATGYFVTVGTSPGGNEVIDQADAGFNTASNIGLLTTGTQYYVTITPYNDLGIANSCVEQTFTTYTPTLPNDICEVAQPVTCSTQEIGSTSTANAVGAPNGSCDTTTDNAGGVWYSLLGTGDLMLLSLCNSLYDTKLQVYEGSCSNLICVTGNDDSCNLQSEVSFVAEEGTMYFIYVSGYGSSVGNYVLDIDCQPYDVPISSTIDQYATEELVTTVLVDTDCATVNNIVAHSHSNNQNIGLSYFTNNGGNFPFDEGIILSSGIAIEASGPFDGASPNGPIGSGIGPGDTDLENALGLPSGSTHDASYIEFNFVPIAPQISFNFLMASSEYNGPDSYFQCIYEDAFAFILTHIPTGTVSNLAVLPTTDTGNFGVSVTNIHPDIPGACPAANEIYFGGYTALYGNMAYAGRTTPLTAFSEVEIGEEYSIKLVVADQGDSSYDTAIFIEGGSFSIGDFSLGDDVFLGDPEAVCQGEETQLNAGSLLPNTGIRWFKDGEEVMGSTQDNNGVVEQVLTIDSTGNYTASIYFLQAPDCSRESTVRVEFYPVPTPNLGPDVIKCASVPTTISANIDDTLGFIGPLQYNWYHNNELIYSGTGSSYSTISIDPVVLIASAHQSGEVQFDNPFTQVEEYRSLENQRYNFGEIVVEVTDLATGCNDQDRIDIYFYQNANCVNLPSGISPNGDGINDCLAFDNLRDEIGNLLFSVFNRHGVLVYESTPYVSEWCGITTQGEELITGTYYYILEFENGATPIKNWIYINRPH